MMEFSEVTKAERVKVLILCGQNGSVNGWLPAIEAMGVQAVISGTGEAFLELWEINLPDLILIEQTETEPDVLDLVQQVRNLSLVPLLLLSANQEEDFVYAAYQAGIDECIIQPISQSLFLAKLQAWLRHTRQIPLNSLESLRAGELLLNPRSRIFLYQPDNPVRLSHNETRIMYILMKNPNRTIEMNDLANMAWGRYGYGSREMLKNVIYRLRKKIEADPNNPRLVVSNGRYGYMLVA